MSKKIQVSALMFILFLMFSGCSGYEEISTSTAEQNSAAETEITVPVKSTESELKYKPADVTRNAVTELTCVSGQYFSGIKALSGGKVLAVSETIENESSKSTMWVIDTASDEVAVKRDIEGGLITGNISVTDKGIAVYIDAEKNFVFFDENLEETGKFKFESGGVFSCDGRKYYTVMSDTILETDVESGSTGLVKSGENTVLSSCMEGLAVGERYAVIQGAAVSEDSTEFPYAVVDITDGSLKLLADNIDYPLCGENNLFITRLDSNSDPENHYFINKNGCYEYGVENIRSSCTLVGDSDIICFHNFSGAFNFKPETVTLYRFSDDGSVKTASVDTREKSVDEACRLKNGNIVFADNSSDGASLNIINMSKVSFSGAVRSKKVYSLMSVDPEIEKQYAEQTKDDVDFTSMTQLKAYKYKFEDKYNVRLFISDECPGCDVYNEYNLTNEEYEENVEIKMIESSLKQLEASFEKYPDNFFEQFTDFYGNNGINIYLAGHIKDEFSAAYAYYDYDYGYYSMIFDISYDIEKNFPHEMWHTTENYINNNNYEALSGYEWAQLNPEGFEYSWEYEGYDEADGAYISDDDDGSERYFIDEYAKVNPMEDKARIMEYVMCLDEDDVIYSGHIKDKLNLLCRAVRDTFDTEGWSDVYWERYSGFQNAE